MGSSALSISSAPSDDTNKLDGFSVHLPMDEIAGIENRMDEIFHKTLQNCHVKSTDDVVSGSYSVQGIGHIKCPEKLQCAQNPETALPRSHSLISEQETKYLCEISTNASSHEGNSRNSNAGEEKEFDVSGVPDGVDADMKGFMNKENVEVMQLSFGLDPKSSQISNDSLQAFSSYSPDSFRVEMTTSGSLRKASLLPVINKPLLDLNLKHLSEKSRKFTSHPPLTNELCMNSNKKFACKKYLSQKPMEIIGESSVSADHVDGLVMCERIQAPSDPIQRENYGNDAGISCSSFMGGRNLLEKTSHLIPERQPSESSKGTMFPEVSYGGRGIHSSKQRTTMVTELNGNALTTLNLFVESSDVSKNTEEQLHDGLAHCEIENHRNGRKKGKALVRDIDYGSTLGLSIDISCCKIDRQSVPIETHMQSEQYEKEVKRITEHIDLDMNVEALANERAEETICLPNVFKGGMEVEHAACVRFESITKDVSLFPDMNLPGDIDEQTINLPHGMSKHTVGLIDQDGVQMEKTSSTNTITHRPKLVLDLNKEHIEITSLDGVDISKDPHQKASILGKRRQERTEDTALQRRKDRHNVTKSQNHNSTKQQVWIQRWYSARTRNEGGLSGQARVLFDAMKEKDSLRYLALGVKQFKDGDVCRIFAASTTDVIPTSEIGRELEDCKISYMKGLPSAAAMAIVGTAARQFCNAQSRKKKSFSFWSGFGSSGRSKTEMADHA